eukprot:CAMPEP_0198490358 /NCGR_PEP_ID=MMETSP1462-20131121/2065_1 /TAXON_ID=1333877 /ORGANISM="Brandtodinium nutriculum, Strain RCC3387" /LENGTH=525 /DNA_ID=CAMNT_0044218911 /DNA_START=77 /DNA_END=1650 /DNA_ORIENTATION=+
MGVDELATPFAKLYFSDEMISKYEPLVTAIQLMNETDGEDEEVKKDYEIHYRRFKEFEWCSNWNGKKYDIVFYGVSGYTGYLMMSYLKRVALKKTPEDFTFAFAGRTPSKVYELLAREFGGTKWENTEVLQMSYDDVFSIIDLVKSARVIVNVAGPYMLTQGEIMVDACVHMGVHYCDISGEVPWTLRLLDLHNKAMDNGVHIIPSSASAGGFPDLGMFMISQKMKADYGEDLRKGICYQSGGGAAAGSSGGTLATRQAMSEAGDDVRKEMANPFSMGGFIADRDRWGVKHCSIEFGTGKVTPKLRGEDLDANMSKISQDPKLGVWRGPFTYSYFDTRIVRRSNMLFADLGNCPYGRNFSFLEYAMLPDQAVLAAQMAKAAAAAAEAARWEQGLARVVETVAGIHDRRSDDAWRPLKTVGPLQDDLQLLEATVTWNDQGFGNAKGRVRAVLRRGGGDLGEVDCFGLAPRPLAQSRTQLLDIAGVKPVRGDSIAFEYIVGGGGGHELEIKTFEAAVALLEAECDAP